MKRSEEQRFTDFVTARSPALLRFARLLADDDADAKDLLQVALVKLAERWSDDIRDPSAYVKRSLVNHASNARRARWRRGRVELLAQPMVAPDPAEALADADALTRALRELTPRQRLMVVLRHVEGMTEAETAIHAGCSLGTVKSHTSRGMATLREALSNPPVELARKAGR